MFVLYPYINRQAVIRNMTAHHSYDGEIQRLLRHLNSKELQILQKNLDLVDRVAEISKLETKELREILTLDHDLEIEAYPGSIWLSVIDLVKRVPENLTNNHTGWWFDNEGEFTSWARDFLMQEVRINLMVRYIEHKKTPTPGTPKPRFGTYL